MRRLGISRDCMSREERCKLEPVNLRDSKTLDTFEEEISTVFEIPMDVVWWPRPQGVYLTHTIYCAHIFNGIRAHESWTLVSTVREVMQSRSG